ncbi:MAG: type I glyceraldehyde-3-phosphate dehydrogenase [Chryseobacterium sp.]|nr:MAG: type I glyceraldehyde-3-phosphate dehydrogenase [Chryseobacterium sp.]
MKSIRIGINGFGRIGRLVFRAAQQYENIQIVGINDLVDVEYMAYMLKYDSIHSRFDKDITVKDGNLIVGGETIRISSEKNPTNLKWDEVSADYVIESTGLFLTKEKAQGHIDAGAKKVIMSGPPKDDTPMFVMGVNEKKYNGEIFVSNASCTTNCVAPIVKILNDNFGVEEALMTAVHATTSSQKTVDSPSSKDWRGGRAASNNIIPSATGAAKAVGKVIPELAGKITGLSFRVPVLDVSVADITFRLKIPASYEEICNAVIYAAENDMKGIVGYTNEDVVSTDMIGETRTSVLDIKAGISLSPTFVKLVSWYDNEYGFSNKILDLVAHIDKVSSN